MRGRNCKDFDDDGLVELFGGIKSLAIIRHRSKEVLLAANGPAGIYCDHGSAVLVDHQLKCETSHRRNKSVAGFFFSARGPPHE